LVGRSPATAYLRYDGRVSSSGELIRRARLRAGLTQRELADRAGKAHSVIGRWERDEVRPSLETLGEVVDATGFRLRVEVVDADDHDLGLIVESLAMTPTERLERVMAMANLVLAGRERVRGPLST